MPDRFLRGPRPPWPITAALASAGVIVIGVLDYVAGPNYNLSVLQSIPLLIAAHGRNRRLLWLIAIFAAAAATLSLFLKPSTNNVPFSRRLINRSLLIFALLVIALVLHVIVRVVQKLETTNTELAQREAEIIRANDALRSSNEKLVQRERTLEEVLGRVEEEHSRLRAVLDTVPFGVAIANADCSEIHVNPAGAAMLNVPPDANLSEAMVPKRVRMFRDGRPLNFEDRPVVRACRKGETIHNEQIDLIFPHGKRLTVLISAAPIRGRGEEITGAVVGWADVSELNALQRELDARRREAEETSIRKSRFLAAVSHDIRTPANAISLLAELMQRTAANPGMVGEIPEIAADLKQSAISLVDLVSDVLDLTRFDSGKVDLQESVTSLGDVIWEECRQLQPTAREKNIEFECDLPDPPVRIRTDRVKLSRILTNLIGNAIKFTDSGGVRTRGCQTENGVRIEVIDTGCGIPREHFAHIFDEFFQLKHADRERSGGSGLGLAICHRLVQAMGGTISVESEMGKGSKFTVELPASVVVPS